MRLREEREQGPTEAEPELKHPILVMQPTVYFHYPRPCTLGLVLSKTLVDTHGLIIAGFL